MGKTRVVLFVVSVVFLSIVQQLRADDPKAESKLVGSWKLVSAKYDGEESKLPERWTTIKHITPTHMMWASYEKNGTVIRGVGGSFTHNGDEFTETAEYGIGKALDAVLGKTQEFNCKVEGNKWYHTSKGSRFKVEELWERLEKK